MISGMDWYDREGNPIDTRRWSELHEDYNYIRVALDTVGPYTISTVWVGLDHQFMEGGPPLIFETMVFTNSAWNADREDPDHEQLLDIECMRWTTEDQARNGHEEVCTLIRATYVEDLSEWTSEQPSDPEK